MQRSDAKLRRSQALAHSSGAALQIARQLIRKKLLGQEQVARHKLLDSTTADKIAQFRNELPNADGIPTLRLIEAQAALAYWSAWSALPINFPKNDLKRVPDHWCSFGARISPLTGSPRLASNPPNAILNYFTPCSSRKPGSLPLPSVSIPGSAFCTWMRRTATASRSISWNLSGHRWTPVCLTGSRCSR